VASVVEDSNAVALERVLEIPSSGRHEVGKPSGGGQADQVLAVGDLAMLGRRGP
jgi:hypothetical protein